MNVTKLNIKIISNGEGEYISPYSETEKDKIEEYKEGDDKWQI